MKITPTLEENLKLLDSFLKLPDNWNGYGAKSFSPVLIQKVKDIIRDLEIQLFIFPTSNSTVQLAYWEDLGCYIEFEISESDEMHLYVENYDGKTAELDVPCTADIVNKAMHKYFLD